MKYPELKSEFADSKGNGEDKERTLQNISKVRPENHYRSKQKSRQLRGCYLGSEHGEIQALLQTINYPALCA